MSFFRGLFVSSLFLMIVCTLVLPQVSHGETVETMEDYKIGAGDVFKIDVWKEPELSLECLCGQN